MAARKEQRVGGRAVRSALFVRCTGPDPKTLKTKHRSFFTVEAGKTTLSCSGLVAAKNVVFTSAWLVAPFINESRPGSLIFDTRVECCGEDGVWRSAQLVSIWKGQEVLAGAMRELTGSDSELVIRGVSQLDIAVLSCDTSGLVPVTDPQHPPLDARSSDRGTPLLVLSSAFALVSPTVFRNSITRGVLSNVVSSSTAASSPPKLFLTDARCLAGSEGAPVFDSIQNRFIGIVLPSPPRHDGHPLELGVIVPYSVFWEDCINAQEPTTIPSLVREPSSGKRANGSNYQSSIVKRPLSVNATAAQSVALIRIGPNWGSGVLIHKDSKTNDGVILTCAHVVQPHFDTAEAISISFRGGPQPVNRIAQIKFSCEGPVDIAFLSVPRLPTWLVPAPMALSNNGCLDGDIVSAVGHAIFEPSTTLGKSATVSTGNVSRVVSHNGKPALLQTCAQVFRGHSGGMLCDERGVLVGIITSNAKHSDGSIIPEINFAVPLCFFSDVIKSACTDSPVKFREIVSEFDQNTKDDTLLKMLWALQPVEQNDTPAKAGGGSFYSFFAKFLESKL